jgi:hypothetical protein
MGLKGYRLWVMGQLDSNVQSPTAQVQLIWEPLQWAGVGGATFHPTLLIFQS